MVAFTLQSCVLFLLLLYATILNQSMSSNHKGVRCNEKDRGALLMFKHGVIDPSNNLSTWSSEKDCCAWKGVNCSSTGRVVKLSLLGFSLAGEISMSLLELEFLNHLDLSLNDFEAISVPPFHDNVTLATNLQYIDLSFNQLKGSILDLLGQQKNLQHLDLSKNHFNGSILEWIGQNEHLQYLDLSNNLFHGSIPSTLGNLSSLESLSIGSNSFSGTITETVFAKLFRLYHLDLSNSTFEFHFNPEWIPPFQLSDVYLANTNLGPYLPSWIYMQKSLKVLDVSSSGISFVGGDKFRSLIGSQLCFSAIYMSNNLINEDLSNLTLNCPTLMLDHNNFTGGLPHLSPVVWYVDFSHNSFSGSIPRDWENSENLFFINLWSNRLSGEIQSELSNMTSLSVINLGNNEFSGTIPNNLPQGLKVMILRSNQFEGNIPPQLFNLSSLFHLDLAHNKLSGTMPRSTYNITEMIEDYYNPAEILTHDVINLFTKGHDYEYKTNVFMRTIDLSANNLSGEVPLGLFGLIKVQTLNLSYNQFTGTISKAIGGMRNLESLDLSNNNFYGEIPQSMALLSFLDYLNISCNNFIGQIPTGTQLQSFNASSYIGNPELCGAPLRKCGTRDQDPKNEKQDAGNENGDPERKSLYLGMGVGFAVGFWGICGSFVLNRKWRHTYYRFLDRVANKLYVILMVKFNGEF